jgi:iron complex outermembrane receptor protein
MRLTPFRISALVLALPSLAAAQAQDSVPADSTRTYEVEGVMVQVARPILTAGGSSAVSISVDSLSTLPAPTLEQVLRTMPLIRIRTNSRGEVQPALRGSEDRQVAILMDGVPLSLGWDHRTDLSIIPLTAARSITLVRGLSSVLYGPNTLGGVVEVSVGAESDRVRGVDPLVVGVGVDHTGATNVSVAGSALAEGAFSQWVVRGGVGFQDRPGFAVPGELDEAPDLRARFLESDGLRLNSDSRRIDGFVTARYRNDDGGWMSLAASGYDVERGVPPEAHRDSPRLWRYPDQTRMLAALAGGTGPVTTGWGTGDLELSLGYDGGRTDIDQFASETYSTVVEQEQGEDRTLTMRLMGEHTMGRVGDLRVAATFADVSHDEVLIPGGSSSYRQRLWSLGLESEWAVGGPFSRLNAGAAVDGSDTPETGDKPPVDGLIDYALRVGASKLLSDRLVIHAAVSRRSRFPSLRELYSGALGRFEPNPDLAPETLLGAEGGITAHGRSAEFQAVAFHHRLSEGIVRTSVTDPFGNQKFMRVNQHEVRSSGIELMASGPLGRAVLSGDLTFQSVKGIDASGARVDLEYQAAVFGRTGMVMPLPAAFQAAGEVRFVGAQRCENPEVGGLQDLGATGMLDLSLERFFGLGGTGRPLSRAEAALTVSNVTDQLAFDQCGLPQPGRTLQLRLRVW